MLVAYTNEGRWEVRTLIEDHNCLQSKEIKACTSRFLSDHIIKSLATNLDIHVRAVQDQTHKQFNVGVSKMKAFREKRIATDKMTGSYREQYSLLREYAQELINQNPHNCPWPGQILTAVGVDANNGIYPVAYAIVEAESKASRCLFLNLLREDLCIEANFNYTFISDRQKGLIQVIASVFPSAEHRYCVRHIHENMKSQFKGDHDFVGYPFDYRVTLGFGSIVGGLDHVNHVIKLPLKHGISMVLGKDDHSNPSVGTNNVNAFIT
ncbi:mutator type transposase [Tanacetum coccineum]